MADLTGNADNREIHARDAEAEARDQRAENRDEEADVRDAKADARDRAAGVDVDLTTFDRPAASPPDGIAAAIPAETSDRTKASWDRLDSMDDRAEAADDRQAASDDRGVSANDRAAAGLDELTGAHRRGAGFVELEREIARAHRTGQPLVLAFVDVNDLKAINDSRGHAAGDQVLRQVVTTLRTKLRSYDLIVRFGGDEFLCAIPGVSINEAANRLDTVNAALEASPEHASVATGFADLQANDSLQDLITRADSALYPQRH